MWHSSLRFSCLLYPLLHGPSVPLGYGQDAASRIQETTLTLERTVVADFPRVQHPVAISLDEKNRLVIAETKRYEKRGVVDSRGNPQRWQEDLRTTDLAQRERTLKKWLANGQLDIDWKARPELFPNEAEGRGSLLTKLSDAAVRLEDKDGDGTLETRSELTSGLNALTDGPAAGILSWGESIYLGCSPSVWKFPASNTVANSTPRQEIARGLGIRGSYYGHDLHGFTMGPDGRLYFTVGDRGYHIHTKEGGILSGPGTGAVLRCWPDGADLEVVAKGLRNAVDLAFDAQGNLFAVDNNADVGDLARLLQVVPGAEFGWEMPLADQPQAGLWTSENMWQMDHANSPAWVLPPIAHLGGGPSGLAAIPGPSTCLPVKYTDAFLLCDFRGPKAGHLHAFKLKPNGASFALEWVETLESGRSLADVAVGYDGRIYVADWGDSWDLNVKSAVVSINHPETTAGPLVAEIKKLAADGVEQLTVEKQLGLLGHADQRIRIKASQALAAQHSKAPEILPKLINIASSTENGNAPQHALWSLGMVARTQPLVLGQLLALTTHTAPATRAQTARLLGDFRYSTAAGPLTALLTDTDPVVATTAALALARLQPDTSLEPAIFQAAAAQLSANSTPLARHAFSDAWARHATPEILAERGLTHTSTNVRIAAVLGLRRHASVELVRFLVDPEPKVATEAARALGDAAVPQAQHNLTALLASLPPSHLTEPLVRRAIEAGLRSGQVENAEAIANYATRPQSESIPDAHRLLALTALSQWDTPPERDGVWGRWVGPTERPHGIATPVLLKYLPELVKWTTGPLKEKCEALLAPHTQPISHEALLAEVRASSTPLHTRLEKLKQVETLGKSASPALTEFCREGRNLAAYPPALRSFCREILIDKRPAEGLSLIREALASGAPLEKQRAVTMLGNFRGDDAKKFLLSLGQQMVDGTLDPVIFVEVLEAAHRFDEKLGVWRKVLDKWRGALDTHSDPLAMYRRVAKYGNAEAGARIVAQHPQARCAECHLSSAGGSHPQYGFPDPSTTVAWRAVGPDLTGVASRLDHDSLLKALVNPSAALAVGHALISLKLKNGQLVDGILREENTQSLTLARPDGLLEIKRDQIAQINPPYSPMPPMGAILAPAELRDVMAYLETLK